MKNLAQKVAYEKPIAESQFSLDNNHGEFLIDTFAATNHAIYGMHRFGRSSISF